VAGLVREKSRVESKDEGVGSGIRLVYSAGCWVGQSARFNSGNATASKTRSRGSFVKNARSYEAQASICYSPVPILSVIWRASFALENISEFLRSARRKRKWLKGLAGRPAMMGAPVNTLPTSLCLYINTRFSDARTKQIGALELPCRQHERVFASPG
jgi:hypothetical protein